MKQRDAFDRALMRSGFARLVLLASLATLSASTTGLAQQSDPPPPPPPYEPPPAEPPPPVDAPPVASEPTPAPPAPPPPAGPPPTGTFPSDPATGSFPSETAAPAARPVEPASPAPTPEPARRATPPVAPTTSAPTPAPSPSYASPPPAPTTDWSVPEAEYGGGKGDDSDGLLGPFRIGPVIGVGMPNLINFGGTLKLTKYFGAGLSVGLIPAIKLSIYGEAKLSYQEYDVYGRIYPFGGGFFLGAGVGYASVKGTITDSVNASSLANEYPGLGIPDVIEYQADGRVRTMILTPQIGYFYTAKSGFSLGLFLGAQFPIAPSDIEFETTVEGLPEVAIERYVAPLDKKVRDTLETVARQPLPSFGLQLGWLL